jgi:hypothetical protein
MTPIFLFISFVLPVFVVVFNVLLNWVFVMVEALPLATIFEQLVVREQLPV